jgi:hypothetical protein
MSRDTRHYDRRIGGPHDNHKPPTAGPSSVRTHVAHDLAVVTVAVLILAGFAFLCLEAVSAALNSAG